VITSEKTTAAATEHCFCERGVEDGRAILPTLFLFPDSIRAYVNVYRHI